MNDQAAILQHEWATDPRWAGVERSYSADDVVRLRGSVQEEHTLARLGAERLWAMLHEDGLRRHPRRADRQPGRAAGQGGPEGHLPVRLAGGGRRQPGRADLPGPEPLPGQLGAAGGPPDQQRAAAGRPDLLGRGGRERADAVLAGADRGRRRGRVRRRAERVRADEGHDRGRSGRGALGGPAGLGEEVRPPGRQGPDPDRPAHPHAERGPARRGRLRRPHAWSWPAPTPSRPP